MSPDNPFNRLREKVSQEKKIINEVTSLFNNLSKSKNPAEKNLVLSHIASLKKPLEQANQEFLDLLGKTGVARPLNLKTKPPRIQVQPAQQIQSGFQFQQPSPKQEMLKKAKIKLSKKDKLFSELEKETLKRLGKKRKKVVKTKRKKPGKYSKIANRFFANYSKSLIKKGKFKNIERNIIKAKLRFTPSGYVSILLLTTLVSAIIGVFIFLFFLFFNVSTELPIVTLATGGFLIKLLKTFWILFAIPIMAFLFMYFYPSMEERSSAVRINEELPFATIHMAAIAGSMTDPSKIFNIIVSTKEYPYIEREFTRLINEINVYGHDLITALKNISLNSPSKKFSKLLNGLATIISSGGDLPEFFQKRSETLLFEYKIDREKATKTSETFMDIYISVVIAAPMILMLLLIMMKISGLGLALSTSTITLMTVLGVFIINIIFLTFLHLKQPKG